MSISKSSKEIQRDILALGSPVFYFLVIARALVGPFWDLANPLVFLAPIVFLLSYFKFPADLYLSRALLMVVVISLHYGDWKFAMFSGLVWSAMIYAALKLGRSPQSIVYGAVLGVALSIAGFFIAQASK